MKIKLFNCRDEELTIAKDWASRSGHDVETTAASLSVESISELEGFDGISTSLIAPLQTDVYAKLASLGFKQIAQRSAGVDAFDLDLANEHGLVISNVPSYSPESIAEFTVTSALRLIRHTELIQKNVANYDFRWQPAIRGRVLGDMTVAILGTGRIGQATARLFKGFGCQVVGYDLYPSPHIADMINYKDSVEEAIKDADVISLHMPATKDNYHLFDKALFEKCQSGAIILNMGRGALIKTEDLLDVLDSGKLSGAGIDTYEHEGPFIPKVMNEEDITDETFKRLLRHPNVLYTPHVAYYTDQAVKNLVEGALNATVEVIETGTTTNRVN